MHDLKTLAGKNKALLLALIVLLQLAILCVMVLNSYVVILRGERILLKVEPFDPRSLFQGDYVRLDYPISRLSLHNIPHDFSPDEAKPRKPVYLCLAEQDGIWEPSFLTLAARNVRDKTYLKGRLVYAYDSPLPPSEDGTNPELANTTILQTEWGIERYFVPEGEGKVIEQKITEGIVYAEIAVYRGKARVIGLHTK